MAKLVLFVIISLVWRAEGRVFCTDKNSDPWSTTGYSCPLKCANVIAAVENLVQYDFESFLEVGHKEKNDTSATLDSSVEATNIDSRKFIEYGKVLRRKEVLEYLQNHVTVLQAVKNGSCAQLLLNKENGPAREGNGPAIKRGVPIESNQQAIKENTTRLDGNGPTIEENGPQPDRNGSAKEGNGPAIEGSASDGNTLAIDGNVPALDKNVPAIDGNAPALEGNEPATDGNRSATDGNVPAIDGNVPALDGNVPATDGNRSATDGNLPALDGNVPAIEGKQPQTEGNGPEIDDMYRLCTTRSYKDDFARRLTVVLNKYAHSDYQFTLEMTKLLLKKILGSNMELRQGVLSVPRILNYLKTAIQKYKATTVRHNPPKIFLTSRNCLTVHIPGCYCKQGYVEFSSQCITPRECLQSSDYGEKVDMYLSRLTFG